MRKITLSIILSIVLYGCVNAQSIDKQAVAQYFNKAVSGSIDDFHSYGVVEYADIPNVRKEIWDIWKEAVNNFDEDKFIELDILENRKSGSWKLPEALEPNAVMPYYWGCNEYPAMTHDKYPLFLYMHGSGDKAQEWESGIGFSLRRFYSPAIYFIPQIPNAYGEYYRWAIQSKQWAWEKLLRLAFVNDTVDANKIYFFGISEGGYGSQRLASFYADYLAGAGPMAGGEPLKNAPMENVANIAFSLRTGEYDNSFGRNILTQKALDVADSLKAVYPGYFNHNIEVIPGYGHSIDYRPTTPWLSQFSRDPHPDFFIWENYEMYGRKRTCFYNLRVIEDAANADNERSYYEFKREGNTISLNVKTVKYTTTYSQGGIEMYFNKEFAQAECGKLRIYLNEEEYDLTKPVRLLLNGKEVFEGKVPASTRTMIESCALYYDPERIFSASLDVDIATSTVISTGIDDTYDECKEQTVYDLSGRAVDGRLPKGIYIRDGQKVYVK